MAKKKPPTESGLEGSALTPQNIPKLRDLRIAIKAEAEREYVEILLILTNGATEEACRIAGLSRFYALRKNTGGPSPPIPFIPTKIDSCY